MRVALNLKDTEIAKLKREKEDLKASNDKLKEKNKMLVAILSQAETKEKALVLHKMEQMKTVGFHKPIQLRFIQLSLL